MKYIFVIICFTFAAVASAQGFAEQQLNFDRVQVAKQRCDAKVRKMFRDSGLKEPWGADSANGQYRKIKTYHVCKGSGDLGPKRKFGDMQVPEGLYFIERYNPNSNFHLSLKVAYPNESDMVMGDKENPGNEIYIHGGCASVGCLPMTDSAVDEIYWTTVLAQNFQGKNAKIPIDIFPCHFNKKNWNYLKTNYSHKPALIKFWQNIEEAFVFFEEKKIAPGYWVDQKGHYNIIYPQNYHLNDPNH
jgi:murein L,D-transpeptidase YafK